MNAAPRHTRVLLAMGASALLLLSACSGDTAGSEEFCEAARTFITFDENTPVERFTELLDEMVETAPNDEIAADAEFLRDGIQAASEGREADVDSAEFDAAGTRVDDYASENCSAE